MQSSHAPGGILARICTSVTVSQHQSNHDMQVDGDYAERRGQYSRQARIETRDAEL